MLLAGLYDFLTYSGDLPGHARDLFAYDQYVYGRRLTCRNDARRHVRDMVGPAVYEARIPQAAGNVATAVTLRHMSGDSDPPLVGETGIQIDVVEFNIWTRGANARLNARTIGRLSRIALANYFGWLNITKEVWTHSVLIARELEFTDSPPDGSDNWPGYWSMDLEIGWTAPAAIYPDEALTAIVTTAGTAATGLTISAKYSHVLTGRPLTNIAFVVRDAQAGNAIKSWSGAPDAVVSGAGLTGLNCEAVATGLPASGWIDLTITDKNGTQASTGVSYGQ